MTVVSGTVLAAELVTGVAASSHEVAIDQRYSELLSRHLNLNWEEFRSQLPNRMADNCHRSRTRRRLTSLSW